MGINRHTARCTFVVIQCMLHGLWLRAEETEITAVWATWLWKESTLLIASYLVGQLQLGEERYVARPFDGAEEQARSKLADVLDAEHVRGAGAGRHRRGRLEAASAARRTGDWVK